MLALKKHGVMMSSGGFTLANANLHTPVSDTRNTSCPHTVKYVRIQDTTQLTINVALPDSLSLSHDML